jgi:DNA-directed RNA polymerase specialized sigma24 family protein
MRRENALTAPPAEPDDFVELYERTVTDVYSYLASRVADRGAAEELTQDVFVVAE